MNCACIFSLDDAYVLPFKVFFHSLLATKSIPESTPVFILHTASLGSKSIANLENYLEDCGRTAFFLDGSSLIPPNLPIREGAYISQASYYRLFIADILPDDVTHIVYLDCDMIAVQSISELFELEYSTPVAAVDQLSPWQSVRLWGDTGGPYFQAGVMLASLNYWRENQMSSVFKSIVRENRDRLVCDDQDVLNIAFKNNWTPLSIGFNVEDGAIKSLSPQWLSENTKIAHFSGSAKPWNSCKDSPYLAYWDQAYREVFGVSFNRNQFKPPFSLRTYIKKVARALISR
jgi:lipopolysaccharide biosynthesis glycosyltransferase